MTNKFKNIIELPLDQLLLAMEKMTTDELLELLLALKLKKRELEININVDIFLLICNAVLACILVFKIGGC